MNLLSLLTLLQRKERDAHVSHFVVAIADGTAMICLDLSYPSVLSIKILSHPHPRCCR